MKIDEIEIDKGILNNKVCCFCEEVLLPKVSRCFECKKDYPMMTVKEYIKEYPELVKG
jgi:hypothetical protein